MKILLLTTHLNIGGVSVYTVNLARYLKSEGVEVAVASSGGELEPELTAADIPHIQLDMKTKAEFGFKVWKTLPVLTNLIKKNGYELVHAQTRVAQVLAFLSARSTGIPFISTCHGFYKHRRLSRRLFPCWGRRVIAISKSVRNHLSKDFGLSSGGIALVYNGIVLDEYRLNKPDKDQELIKAVGMSDKKITVGAVGRLSPVKGYRYLVEAFKDVVSKGVDAQLLMVGDGPEKDALVKQVRKLDLADQVFFTPGGGAMHKYLALMDVFCIPSLQEGLGLSLMEAMASGRACIASRVGGLKELIKDNEDGVFVPPKDPGQLSVVITRLLGNRSLRQRLSDHARVKALREFSIEESAKKTLDVYKEVLG